MTNNTDRALKPSQTVPNMSVNTIRAKRVEMVSTLGLMAQFMMVAGLMIKSMVMEFIFGLMVANIMDSGRTV
jgi:hypothetical protein